MGKHDGGVWSALAWLIFPLVPALLGSTYQQTFNQIFYREGPDPRLWGWLAWVLLAGPLVGYGFLAGATLDLPDDSSRRGWRGWPARRSIWVGVGPWAGFLFWTAVFNTLGFVDTAMALARPDSREWFANATSHDVETWTGWALAIGMVGTLAYGWLFVAMAALVRARRLGRCRRAIGRGLTAAIGFVGSLFGSFWALTEAWRAYYFDPRIVPIIVAASSLALLAGCAGTVTYGEVRRRELFQALLMAWLLGLALVWRWWSRPRK